MTSKIDYLQKYLNSKSSKGNKKKKSKKNERAETKNITIVNDNLDVIHDTEEIGGNNIYIYIYITIYI